jgi:hypothetical protein
MAEHDLGDLITRASNSLESDISVLAAYTAVAGGISDLPEGTELPEADLFFTFGFGPQQVESKIVQNPIIEQVRKDFGLHSSRYAVLAMITAFEVYLERMHWLSLLMKHAHSNGPEISSEKMHTLRNESLRIAMGKNPPQMMEAILVNLRGADQPESLKWVKSIYGARKILSHRNGIVSEVDADKDGTFTLLRRTVTVEDEDEGSVLKFVGTTSEYKVGEELVITPKECQEIAFALISAADNLTELFSDVGRRTLNTGPDHDES